MQLNDSVQKNDIVDRLIGIKVGATHKPSDDYDDGNFEISLAILYITDDVKCVLRDGLPVL